MLCLRGASCDLFLTCIQLHMCVILSQTAVSLSLSFNLVLKASDSLFFPVCEEKVKMARNLVIGFLLISVFALALGQSLGKFSRTN